MSHSYIGFEGFAAFGGFLIFFFIEKLPTLNILKSKR